MSLIMTKGENYSLEYYVKGERYRDVSNIDVGLLIRKLRHKPIVKIENLWFVAVPKELL